MPQLESSNCLLIFGVIIIIATLGMVMYMYKCSDGFRNLTKITESFSPIGWTQNCPPPRMGNDIIGSCGPGCIYKCKYKKNCPNLEVGGCGKHIIPTIYEEIPLGWGGTMSGPYAGQSGCASGINGVANMSYRNEYGSTTPYGDQMYGMCDRSESNPFDNAPYGTFY
jgi:hypothetical protein